MHERELDFSLFLLTSALDHCTWSYEANHEVIKRGATLAVLDDSVVDEPSGGAWRSSGLAFAIPLVTCQMASLLATQVSRTSGPRPGVESTEEWGSLAPHFSIHGGGSTARGRASPRASWICCRGQNLSFYLVLHPVLLRRPCGCPGECKCDLGTLHKTMAPCPLLSQPYGLDQRKERSHCFLLQIFSPALWLILFSQHCVSQSRRVFFFLFF